MKKNLSTIAGKGASFPAVNQAQAGMCPSFHYPEYLACWCHLHKNSTLIKHSMHCTHYVRSVVFGNNVFLVRIA